MTSEKKHLEIIEHYEKCLIQHGDSHLGVDWPNHADAETRYKIMLECILEKDNPISLLDFGCGASHLLDFIKIKKLKNIAYSGLDASKESITLSRKKYPDTPYYFLDVLDSAEELPMFDYIIMNGVFTEKRSLSQEEMSTYFSQLLRIAFGKAKRGIAFNVMSAEVDWKRDDLFHLSTDVLIHFLAKNLSRNFLIRNDYGLYEYTTYVYKEINHGKSHHLWHQGLC
ncbi:MAG: hypothetical protein ACI802_000462 [Candidatus Paceibacteria bacterium]|jgi:hypothetical protein